MISLTIARKIEAVEYPHPSPNPPENGYLPFRFKM